MAARKHYSTAQERYAAMIRDQVSPALRQRGLRGSKGIYDLRSATHWALIGFQKSTYSDRDELRFTVNLSAIDRAIWEEQQELKPHIGNKPRPNTYYGTWALQSRIGTLLPDGADKWWHVTQSAPTTPVADDLLNDLERYGLPWLRANVSEIERSVRLRPSGNG